MIITLRRYMQSLVGNCKIASLLLLTFMLICPLSGQAQDRTPDAVNTKTWNDIRESIRKQDNENYKKGLSYIISGSSALVAGILGERASSDPIDKAIYSTFQVIGVASVGFGAYKWKIEDEDKLFYNSLEASKDLKPQDKLAVMENYYRQKKEREGRERVIKAITHGMVAALNIYGASVQSNNNIKNGLYFLAGVNVFAAISFTF